MYQKNKQQKSSALTMLIGFLVLFFVYHIPEFLQRHYRKPLLLLMEICMLIAVLIFFFILSQQNKKPQYDSGLSDFKNQQRNLYIGLSIGILLIVGLNFLTILLQWNSITIKASFTSVLGQSFLFVIGTFLPSLAEDLLTRAYLLAHRPKHCNPKWMIFFSALVYTINHIFRLDRPDVLLYLFALGILLMMCLILTRSLWLTLGIHWGSNIAYQFFANIATVNTLKEIGYENYLLSGFYITGIILVLILWKSNLLKTAEKPAVF
jgi:hypothetical protein